MLLALFIFDRKYLHEITLKDERKVMLWILRRESIPAGSQGYGDKGICGTIGETDGM